MGPRSPRLPRERRGSGPPGHRGVPRRRRGWRAEARLTTVGVDGARLHVRVDGPSGAPALVLSNSLGTDLSMWGPQMPALRERFRVVRYDLRGHGRSDVTSGPVTI